MKEKTTKQSSLLTCDEIVIAQILLDLPSMIWTLESRSALKWGTKKMRSRCNQSSMRRERHSKSATAEEEVATTASPDTPLAFSPSESDEKLRRHAPFKTKRSSREEYVTVIEELIQSRDLLREEIENVTKYYKKLIAYNSDLKAMKHKVLNSYQIKEEAKVDSRRDIIINVEKSQPQTLQSSFGPISAQFDSGLGKPNHKGPVVIPDLNVAAEEDQSQPLDMERDFRDRRARSAEARRRRMDIIKIKSMRSAYCGFANKLARIR